jgi:serine/threonine protein kinase, bacterial
VSDTEPPRGHRFTGRTPIRVGAAATLAVTAVLSLALWLTGYLPLSNARAIRVTVLDDGVLVGSSHAGAVLDVFGDPLCPPCARLATSSAHDIRRAVDEKKVAVRYHLVNYEDSLSASGDYSTRAIGAALCVAAAGDPSRYQAFYTALFAPDFLPKIKPASADHTDADLAHLAQTLGASPRVGECINSKQRIASANNEAANASAFLKRLQGNLLTPMIFLGGREVDYANAGWIDNLQ